MEVAKVLDNMIPASDFNRGKSSQAFRKSTDGNPVFVVKNNVPEHVILTVDDYKKGEEAKEDLALLSLAVERWARFDPNDAVSEEELLEEFGIPEEELAAAPDSELE